MIHPGTKLKEVSDSIGVGVFAKTRIPKGTLVYVHDVLEIELSPLRFSSLDEPLRSMAEKYSFIDAHGYRILSWDTAKYVNHSCDPNTMSAGYGFEIALRDIEEGEEITDEYGLFNLQHDVSCLCGSKNCRHVISGSDIDEYYEKWDSWVRDALQYVRSVDQPLIGLMDPDRRRALEKYLNTGQGYRSVRALKHVGREESVNVLDVNGEHIA
jgi:hypothetical protein